MINPILEDIKKYAFKKLKEAYGYCGAAESEDMVLLNSDDKNGNDIEIKIKTKKS